PDQDAQLRPTDLKVAACTLVSISHESQQDIDQFVGQVGAHFDLFGQHLDGLVNDLVARQVEKCLELQVGRHNPSGRIDHDDGVVRRFEDRFQEIALFLQDVLQG